MRAAAEAEFGRPPAGDETPPTGSGAARAGDASADLGADEGPPEGRETGSAGEPPRPVGERVDPPPSSRPSPGGQAAAPVSPPVEEPVAIPAPAGQEPDAAILLADADRAYSGLRSLRATFVQRVEVPLLDRTSQGFGDWLQAGRDRFRMDFTDPPEDLFVADGEFLWLYQPSATPGQVLQCELAGGRRAAGGADVLARILSEARESYDSRYEGTAIVSGVRTHVIELRPRGPADYREVRVWIADRDRLVRRFRIVEENETIRTVTLADLEPNARLDSSLFTFTLPDGADVFDC